MTESGSKSGVDQLFFNGIDGSTGGYLLPPLSVVDLARLISGQPTDDNLLRGLQTKAAGGLESVFAPMPGLDAADLAQHAGIGAGDWLRALRPSLITGLCCLALAWPVLLINTCGPLAATTCMPMFSNHGT